jgi:hypothetical protein
LARSIYVTRFDNQQATGVVTVKIRCSIQNLRHQHRYLHHSKNLNLTSFLLFCASSFLSMCIVTAKLCNCSSNLGLDRSAATYSLYSFLLSSLIFRLRLTIHLIQRKFEKYYIFYYDLFLLLNKFKYNL